MGSVGLQPLLLAHDASPVAWFIVAGYFAGAAVSFVAMKEADDRRERVFWAGCSLLLLLLGLNKQLDLQSWITTVGRRLAHEEGWFGQRRLVQAAFVFVLGSAAAAAVITLFVWLRRSAATVKLAAVGIVLLFTFILLRAASFHHMDSWVTYDVASVRIGWWLEIAGILVIGLSALTYARSTRSRRR